MDRFIVLTVVCFGGVLSHLKSNMDRFIESVEQSAENVVDNLKSNMDRFIVYRFHQ